MNKIINTLKNYKPSKKIFLLYLFIPLLCATLFINVRGENDIWFLLNHGKYVLHHGFPTTDPFSMHRGLQFVMQQWLVAVIYYIVYSISHNYGLLILLNILNFAIVFLIYKLSMILSDGRYKISVLVAIVGDIALLLMNFIVPRPQIFTYIFLLITLLIMEKFYKNEKNKAIYFLPLISILQINFHASMYFMLYIFMLPYLVNFIYLKIKNRNDNRIFKLLLIWIIMFVCAFINPYGIKAITYIFSSYGYKYINDVILEMKPVTIKGFVGLTFYIFLTIQLLIYIFGKKGHFQFRHVLLFGGLTYLSLNHFKNIGFWIIGTFPLISCYLKNYFTNNNYQNKSKKLIFVYSFFVIIIGLLIISNPQKPAHRIEKGINKLMSEENITKKTIYTSFNNGGYVEFRGLKPYIDPRAEVFLKSVNKKEDIFIEYYKLNNGKMEYDEFIKKYNFDYLLVDKNESIYSKVKKDKNYRTFYNNKTYKIFKKIN